MDNINVTNINKMDNTVNNLKSEYLKAYYSKNLAAQKVVLNKFRQYWSNKPKSEVDFMLRVIVECLPTR